MTNSNPTTPGATRTAIQGIQGIQDPHPTIDAIKIIGEARRTANAGGDLPLVCWSILAHAEDRLNRQLREYFIPAER